MVYKKAQLDIPIIAFAALILGLLILAPITLKMFNSIQQGVSPALGNITGSGAVAQANFDSVMTPLVTMWDKVLTFAFIVSIIMLLVSSFMIDTHPVWIVLYIVAFFILILFLPNMLQAADAIYTSADFVTEVSQLTYIDNIRSHYVEWMVGLGIITGIIIFGKVGLFGSIGGGASKGSNR